MLVIYKENEIIDSSQTNNLNDDKLHKVSVWLSRQGQMIKSDFM